MHRPSHLLPSFPRRPSSRPAALAQVAKWVVRTLIGTLARSRREPRPSWAVGPIYLEPALWEPPPAPELPERPAIR